jgi:EpsI family protein
VRSSTRLAASCLLLLGTFSLLHLRSTGEAVAIRKPLESLPSVVGGWRGQEDSVLGGDLLGILKVDDYLIRRYRDGAGRSLWLYIGYWATQRKGAQIHSPKNCLPGGGWEPLEASRLAIDVPGKGQITVNRYLIQKDRDMQIVLYWYQSQGRAVAGEVQAKMDMVRNAILRNRTDGALVRVSGPVSGSVAETTERLVTYVQALDPILSDYLPE